MGMCDGCDGTSKGKDICKQCANGGVVPDGDDYECNECRHGSGLCPEHYGGDE